MIRRASTWIRSGVGGTSSVTIGKQSRDELATTTSTTTRKTLLPFEALFQPFMSTEQEKHLLRELYSMSFSVVVISSFRGSRASTTVQRVAQRLKYRHIGMGLWPWVMQVEYVCDYPKFEQFLTRGSSLHSLLRAAMQVLGSLLVAAGCGVAFHFASVWWHGTSISQPTLWERIVSRTPGREDLLAFAVLLFLLGSFTFRKKIVVIDDLFKFPLFPLQSFKFPLDAQMSLHDALGYTLDLMKDCARNGHRIAIVSSNEGICRLFSDTNPSTYMLSTFPRASDEEMVQALQRCNLGTTSAEFEHVKQLYAGIPHHLYSTRWWLAVAKHLPHIPRTVLFEIALELDLQCELVARYYSLAYSREVDVATAIKNLFTAAEVADIVRIYGPRGPRRLVLTAGLLITGRDASLESTVAMKPSLQEGTCAELQVVCLMSPAGRDVTHIEQLESVKAHHSVSAEAAAEFRNAVRFALEPGTDTFQADGKCQKEIGRIKRLLV